MLHIHSIAVFLANFLLLLTTWLEYHDCLIITSVLAGDKKFKTVSFDTKFLKPLTFEKEMPTTEFRRHRTVRPPKFDIDVNIPIKLPLEDEYAKEEPNKPVTSNFFFQTGEIVEPAYPKSREYSSQKSYKNDLAYAASNRYEQPAAAAVMPIQSQETDLVAIQPQQNLHRILAPAVPATKVHGASPRSDEKESQQQPDQAMVAQESGQYLSKGYGKNYDEYVPDFIPGGYVNLQLSGPTGGPKATYEDYDREKWAQQLSQAPGAMPYPILNYHQLQNFYGGLGTFTNGLAENRYAPMGILDKLKSVATHFSNKLHHIG